MTRTFIRSLILVDFSIVLQQSLKRLKSLLFKLCRKTMEKFHKNDISNNKSSSKSCSKGLYALYSSPNIIRVIKSRKLRWAGHVARIGEERCIQGFSGET
jgi:hypothetical protein